MHAKNEKLLFFVGLLQIGKRKHYVEKGLFADNPGQAALQILKIQSSCHGTL